MCVELNSPTKRGLLTLAIFLSQLLAERPSALFAEEPQAVRDTPSSVVKDFVPPKESWTTFRNGPLQQGVATGTLPESLTELWTRSAPDGWLATACILNDRVYVGSLTGYFYCLELKTGKVIWKHRSIESTDPDEFAAGFKSAPLVTDTLTYIGDEDGVVHALETKSGKLAWQLRTDAEIAGSPAIYKEKLIVGSHDSYLYCADAKTGAVAWKFQTGDRINCSPAIADHFTFVAGCDNHLRVIDVNTGEQVTDIDLQSYLIASPAIFGDVLYVGTHDAEVLAVNWKTGNIVWRFRSSREFPIHGSAAVTEDFVIVGGQDKLMHCLDRKSGKEIWNFKTRAQINSSPVLVGKRIFFGCDDGNLYELSLADGKELSKRSLGRDVVASPAVAQGMLVIGSGQSDGKLFCFGAEE